MDSGIAQVLRPSFNPKPSMCFMMLHEDKYLFESFGFHLSILIPSLPLMYLCSNGWIRSGTQKGLQLHINVTASVFWWLAFWPLEPEFVGSNPAEAVGFFGRLENSQYAFLRRGSKRICPISQLCGT